MTAGRENPGQRYFQNFPMTLGQPTRWRYSWSGLDNGQAKLGRRRTLVEARNIGVWTVAKMLRNSRMTAMHTCAHTYTCTCVYITCPWNREVKRRGDSRECYLIARHFVFEGIAIESWNFVKFDWFNVRRAIQSATNWVYSVLRKFLIKIRSFSGTHCKCSSQRSIGVSRLLLKIICSI